MVTSYIFAIKRDLSKEHRASLKEVWRAFLDSILAICGFRTHRYRLGALNIINAPVDGNSLPA